MKTSKFLQIFDGILLEYIYTDQNSPVSYSTNSLPIEILDNLYTGEKYLFNTEAHQSISNNARTKSAVPLDESYSKFASLDTGRSISYNDIDDKLTNSNLVIQTFAPSIDVIYESVKIHFTAGFNFRNFDGFIFNFSCLNKNNKNVNLSSKVYLKTDSAQLNPSPLLLGERLYSTYIEFKIPSTRYLIDSFIAAPTNINLLSNKLTSGIGILKTTKISCKIYGISSIEREQGFSIYQTEILENTYITTTDIFSSLQAFITKSDNGDYFEAYGVENNIIIANFMSSLNSQTNSDWMIFHHIEVIEQISTNFITTSTQTFTQNNNYDLPIIFRPVIMNSSVAVSFSLNYVMRIYNKITGEQIIRNSSLSSREVGTYGRKLRKLNVGKSIVPIKIYNKIVPDNDARVIIGDKINVKHTIENTVGGTPIKIQTVINTVYRDRAIVIAKISPVTITVNPL